MAVEVEIPVKPHTFVDGTPAIGAEVNANFDKIIDESYTTIGHAFNGWFSSPATVEYHSANSIKTTSDVDLTSLLQEGDKITWEHGTTGGDRFGWISFPDYDDTVANRSYIEIIGDEVLDEPVVADSIGVSRIENPFGFPAEFIFTPIYGGFSADPTPGHYSFTIRNKICTVWMSDSASGTSNANNLTIQVPVKAKTISGGLWGNSCSVVNNTSFEDNNALCRIVSGSNAIVFGVNLGNTSTPEGSFTPTGSKRVYRAVLDYPII